jgi:two-component system response regulator AtoC
LRSLVLIVEDEALLARNVKTYLERREYEVAVTGTVRGALSLYAELQPDAILIDQNLPDGLGMDLIRKIRSSDRTTKLVMVTAHGSVETAVEAMKCGADDYLTKPVSLHEIALLLEKLVAQTRLESSLSYFRTKEQRRSGLDRILGNSAAIQEVKARIGMILDAERAASGKAPGPPVLILGETGTGKELVARALHFDGPRRDRPFVEVNCAALPEQLVESELFGHERGAFTDARERKIGLFQAADGGTLFLDEVGELTLQAQAKLLKAIEDRVIRPVGGLRDRRVDVRVVAATNASLEDKVRQNEFRSDLFYRLNTISISSPPLRSRGADVLLLADTFLIEFRSRYGRGDLEFSKTAKAALLDHSWPGNVRELRNVIEQACLLTAGNSVQSSDLSLREPALIQSADGSAPAHNATLTDVERELITNALRQAHGNVTLAARALGVSRDTLRYRMDKYALRREGFV